MSKWDSRILALADLVASWSKDPSTQVGAAIVDSKNRVVSIGFNGFPRAVRDIEVDRNEKLRRTIHAEENALLFAARSVEGCTIYVTHPPCAHCAAKLIQAGVVRVVSNAPAAGFSERWAEDMASASTMLREAGVVFEEVSITKENDMSKLQFLKDNLAPGEVYAGVILGQNGEADYHLILLPGEADSVTWAKAKAFAKNNGGALPDRRELRLLWVNAKQEFQPNWYWSSEQRASDSGFAWMQGFGSGYQGGDLKSRAYRARAVRRLPL